MKDYVVGVMLVVSAACVAYGGVGTILAQTPSAPAVTAPKSEAAIPTLSREQQLQIQTIVQEWEIARLRADAAKLKLEAYVASLKREGFDLDLTDLNNPRYVKKVEGKKDPPK